MRGFGSCYQRGRIWWIEFWQKGKRTRESVGSEKERDAQNLLKRRLAEEQNQLPSSSLQLTVRHLYGALELDYVINKRKSLRNIRQMWECHLKAAFGEAPAHLITPVEIDEYIAKRQKEGAKNATINRELSSLKRMYTLAIRTRRLASKPYIQHLVERNVRKGFVKDSEYQALARETAEIGLWLRAMFEVAHSCGWRKSELLSMRVRQVDLGDHSISLDPGETKNDQGRLAELTDSVFELVRQCVVGKGPMDFVFTRERESNGRKTKTPGGKIGDFRDDWNKATAAAGCPGLLFHDLRRSAVRNLDRDGVGQKEAMMVTGHRTTSVYQRYNIMDRSRLSEVRRKMQRGAMERQREARQRQLFEQAEIFPESVDERKPPAAAASSELDRRKIQ